MRPGDLLRQLDRRLLPPLARGMARLGQGPLRLRVLTGAALLSSAAVLVTAVWAADRQPVGDLTVGEVTRVGVVQGQSIPRYVESSRGELTAMLAAPSSGPARQTYALVTMSAYLAPDRLTPILGEVSVSEVFSRLWLPETQTQIVRIPAFRIPDDVIAGMFQVAERKDREARDYQERSAAMTGDSDRERELRGWYESGARVASGEATAYRSRCSCVYAAVVRGIPDALEKIASRPEVRAVDPAPEVRRLDRTVFTPPLPEQDDVVRPPADAGPPLGAGEAATRPAESGEPGGATPSPGPGSVGDPSPDPLPATSTAGPASPDAPAPTTSAAVPPADSPAVPPPDSPAGPPPDLPDGPPADPPDGPPLAPAAGSLLGEP